MLHGTASIFGLTAAAVGGTSTVYAAPSDPEGQTLLLPDSYTVRADGVIMYASPAGEHISLLPGQYVVLESGFVLVVGPVAHSYLVSPSFRFHSEKPLYPDLGQVVQSTNGSVVEDSRSSPLWTGEGAAPRLFENGSIQTYELAQNSNEADDDGIILFPTAAALGLGGAFVLSSFFSVGVAETEAEEELTQPASAASSTNYYSHEAIVLPSPRFDGDTFYGTSKSDFVGITPLQDLAQNETVGFDMSAGGNNFLIFEGNAAESGQLTYTGGKGSDIVNLGHYVATSGSAVFDMSAGGENTLFGTELSAYGGLITYEGGKGPDRLIFGEYLAYSGTASFDMSVGGENTLIAAYTAGYSATMDYTGGQGDDTITFLNGLADDGTFTLDMAKGGNNSFFAGESAASSGVIDYIGGNGRDTLIFADWLAYHGTATFEMSAGGDNLMIAGDKAGSAGTIDYIGGAGQDILGLGDRAESMTIDFGNDAIADAVFFDGSATGFVIKNFDLADGDEIHLNSALTSSITYAVNPVDANHVDVSHTGPSVSLTIENITVGELNSNHYNSPTGLVIGSGSVSGFGNYEPNESIGTSYTGSSSDEVIGITPLKAPGKGGSVQFDMSAGGNNRLVAGESAAVTGSLAYTGGSGSDDLTFTDDLAKSGTAVFEMSLNGDNSLLANHHAASAGSLIYTGGTGDDTLAFGESLGANGGTGTFDMSAGGDNWLTAGEYATNLQYTGGGGRDSFAFGAELAKSGTATFDLSAGGENILMADFTAASGGLIDYTGGKSADTLTFTTELAKAGTANFDMIEGGKNTLVAGSAAASSGSLNYTGGPGQDILGFGPDFAQNGTVLLDLGNDSEADSVFFGAAVGAAGGTVTIQNFDLADGDQIHVDALSIANVLYTPSGASDVTVANASGAVTVSFVIQNTSVTALSSSHFDSATGLIIG